jgi:integrase
VRGLREVTLRGLAPLVITELLYGLQQQGRRECMTSPTLVRGVARDLRRVQASGLAGLPAQDSRGRGQFARVISAQVRRALTDPQAEVAGDVWDLAVLGHAGRLAFTGITQRWLREAAKKWVAHDLPRHRGRQAGGHLGVMVTAAGRLSASLRAHRDDHGDDPAVLGRTDIEAFLHRLAFLAADGQISASTRVTTCQSVRRLLTGIRALGLTRPGSPAAGLPDDFSLAPGDVPLKAAPGEPGRDIPAEIMRRLCERLPGLGSGASGAASGTEARTAVELLIDTGRRPAEICGLGWDCLARDTDGGPVLVYDNAKVHRLRRRLPIGEHTAELITRQQSAVRARFPATPPAELALLPSPQRNPGGQRPITEGNLLVQHKAWLAAMGPLRRADGTDHPRARITPYSYRHSYAQRHADAGIPIDVLRELMDHTIMDSTRRYYRVGEARRREAVDLVTTMQFDRHGNRIWRDAKALLDAAHARYAITGVAVPYGTCTEPSNVQAGGGACPIRFRCAGCDHFRTDVSYLPDLTAYLDDLLRTRERLQASVSGVDEWARLDATPAEEEITCIRRLIAQIKGDTTALTDTEKHQIAEAVAVVRRHRGIHLGMPAVRKPLPSPRSQALS